MQRVKGRGKGGGGGDAPPRAEDTYPYELQEVIQIVKRARRPHMGLVETHGGRVTNTRAWGFHAGLRSRNAVADYEFEPLDVATSLNPD